MLFRDFLDPYKLSEIIARHYEMGLLETVQLDFVHRATKDFVAKFRSIEIPTEVKEKARNVFLATQGDPMRFLKHLFQSGGDVWQAKINDKWRALAVKVDNTFVWYWIGPREELNSNKSKAIPNMTNINAVLTNKKPYEAGQQHPLKVR